MQEVITSPVSLSDSAAKEFIRLTSDNEVGAGKYLRVGVKGGGCSGLTYILDFDEKKELDEEYIIKGVKVLIDPRHSLYLHGMEVDFENGLNDRGFIFNNPNASSTCGCGTSFAT
ncbi:MAG: HesB/IscA family protein [Bacteroidia bacterium]